MTVRTSRCRCFLFLSDITNRNGGNCLMHLMKIATGVLTPASWDARWPITGTLAFQPYHLSSLTSALLSLSVGPHILDMLVKKYGQSGRSSVTPMVIYELAVSLIGVMPSRNLQPGFGPVPARPQMNLDQFVCASVVVRQMCELYERCSAGGRPQISRDQFLQSVICLP